MKIRPCVMKFARQMERKLRENDYKGGWEKETNEYLLSRLREETDDVENWAKCLMRSPIHLQKECADVANFAMMIYDNSKRPER